MEATIDRWRDNEELGRRADETSEKGEVEPAEAIEGVPREELTRVSERIGTGRATRGDRDDTETRQDETESLDYQEET